MDVNASKLVVERLDGDSAIFILTNQFWDMKNHTCHWEEAQQGCLSQDESVGDSSPVPVRKSSREKTVNVFSRRLLNKDGVVAVYICNELVDTRTCVQGQLRIVVLHRLGAVKARQLRHMVVRALDGLCDVALA